MKPEILLSEAENISETIVNQRRALHRMPGTEFDLGETLAYVKKELQDMGYEIVPVSKLIMTEDYHMDANGMQIKD